MPKYLNRWPNDKDQPEAPDEERCQFEPFEGKLCGLGRYPGLDGDRCIFHLPDGADRPDDIVLRFAIQEAVQNRVRLEGANLPGANLEGANLQQAELDGANLHKAILVGANLDKAILWKANLQKARLEGANLRKSNLLETNLQEAHLFAADLRGARLTDANLQKADLMKANLQQAHLFEADLQQAHLDYANLQGAHLDYVNLQGAYLTYANLQGADLRCASITGEASLTGADLTHARLEGASISPDTNLEGVTWGPNGSVVINLEEPDGAYAKAEHVYRQIKRSYEESGDYRRAGDFFFREMECKRKAAKPWSWERAKLWFMGYLCGYGERPANTAVAGLALFVVFTFIHAFLGLFVQETVSGHPVLTRAHNLDLAGHMPGWDEVCELGKAAYFSIVTFASLGYGNLLPAPGWGEFFAGLEVVLGVFLMALFLVTFTRKFQR